MCQENTFETILKDWTPEICKIFSFKVIVLTRPSLEDSNQLWLKLSPVTPIPIALQFKFKSYESDQAAYET